MGSNGGAGNPVRSENVERYGFIEQEALNKIATEELQRG
jgi:hypothetical protein